MGMSFGQFAGVSFDQLVETMVDLAVNGTHGRFVEDVMPRREPARLAPLEIHRPSESVRPVRRGQPLDVNCRNVRNFPRLRSYPPPRRTFTILIIASYAKCLFSHCTWDRARRQLHKSREKRQNLVMPNSNVAVGRPGLKPKPGAILPALAHKENHEKPAEDQKHSRRVA